MENVNNSGDRGEALFNAGLAKLQRIDEIKRGLFDCKLNNDFVNWHRGVDLFLDELWEFLNPEERSLAQRFEIGARNLVYASNPKYVNHFLIRNALHRYERQLLDFENKYKLSMPDKASAGSAANG